MSIMLISSELRKISSYIVSCYTANHFPSSTFSFYEQEEAIHLKNFCLPQMMMSD